MKDSCEKHHAHFCHVTHTHRQDVLKTDEGGGPTYGAVSVRVAGWMGGEVWEEKVVDGRRRGGVQASGRRRVGAAASAPGTLSTESACRTPPDKNETFHHKRTERW